MRGRVLALLIVVAAILVAGGPSRAAVVPSATVHTNLLQLAGPQQSNNWAGYNQGAAERNVSGGFHSITGDWLVPKVTPRRAGESEYSSTWIGIGGGCVNSDCSQQDKTLIQTGTEQDVLYDPIAGTTTEYSAWWEIIPDSDDQRPIEMRIHPGDRMHASIVETSTDHWTVTLQNKTDPQSVSIPVSFHSTYGSAEWITEAPTVVAASIPPTIGFAPLPNLSLGGFDVATVNGSRVVLNPSEQFQLVDLLSGEVEATPSAPDKQADGFNICSYSETCRTP
jgi:hypothetical protein